MEKSMVLLKNIDLQLLDFIAKFGVVNVNQLHDYYGGSLHALKIKLAHLVKADYVIRHKIFFEQPDLYTVTKLGDRTGLGIVKKISLMTYEHNVLVVDVFLKLRHRFSDYSTEKMIRAERGVGVGKSGHIPDLIGIIEENTVIAIELDRTTKGLDRVKNIIASYASKVEFDQIWFICASQRIFNNLEKVSFSNKIKLFHLQDILSGKELAFVPRSDQLLRKDIPDVLRKFFS